MAKFIESQSGLPTEQEAVDSKHIRRSIKGTGTQIHDMMTRPDSIMFVMLLLTILLVVIPWLFIYIGIMASSYYFWASSARYKLPFKIPINWGGTDYGSPKPGQPGKYATASGILCFGRDESTLEELWIENGDARRHGFFIGTTGSGKALPMDALVLTPQGWMENGDLLPGMTVCHPDGGTSKILSVHPQGIMPGVRLHFADGRMAECSRDHLWHVRTRSRPGTAGPEDTPPEGRIIKADDLGILHGLYPDGFEVCIPLPSPYEGRAPSGTELSEKDAALAAHYGMNALDYMPSLVGTTEQRRVFLGHYLRIRSPVISVEKHGLRIYRLHERDAKCIKQIIWSLGGMAATYIRDDDGLDVLFMVSDIDEFHSEARDCLFPNDLGLQIVEINALDSDVEMSCIKVDREDGLYVMENHVVTHNTELLLGVVSQTMMWSSGFLFVDGKGTVAFYGRVWTLCKRFGREDDLRILNFTDPGGDMDAPAGGPATQSNTMNPFAKGSPDQLMNIIVSLMGDAGQGNDMWKSRATSLVTAMMMCLCELRDNGDILLNVQTIRDFLALGKGFEKDMLGGRKFRKLEDIPEQAWEEMGNRAGLIELYLRARKGELSEASRLAMDGFFTTLPGFSIEKALNGDNQETKCTEQYGFLSMQLTKPLGSLADGYGHIFRTPLGEIDMDDIVLNRRILVVLLPALQKAHDEVQNCGKIIVTMIKIMMGNASGSKLSGTRQEIIESSQTNAPSPFIVVLDEAGYYMVKGIDAMMAQARSLGFMIIVAGQDLAAMQAADPQIAETVAANASILAVGKTTDGNKTLQFVQQLMGKTTVSVSSGYTAKSGSLSSKMVDRMDVTFQEVDRVRLEELQKLIEGQFYLLFNGRLVRVSNFFIGDKYADNFSVNKFLKIRGPTDRVPGLDQSVEIDFLEGYVSAVEKFSMDFNMDRIAEFPRDGIHDLVRIHDLALSRTSNPGPDMVQSAWLAGILGVYGMDGSEADLSGLELDEDESDEGWVTEIDDHPIHSVPGTQGRGPGRVPEFEDRLVSRHGMRQDAMHGMRQGTMQGRREGAMQDRREMFAGQDNDMAVSSSRMRAPAGGPDRMRAPGGPDRMRAPGGPDSRSSFKPRVITENISDSLEVLAQAETPRARHGALIGLLAQEDEAIRAAENSGSITDLDVGAPDVNIQTLGSVFADMANQMTRMERYLVSELAEGNIGAEIMQRAVSINPMPLPGSEANDYIKDRLASLEEQFGSDL